MSCVYIQHRSSYSYIEKKLLFIPRNENYLMIHHHLVFIEYYSMNYVIDLELRTLGYYLTIVLWKYSGDSESMQWGLIVNWEHSEQYSRLVVQYQVFYKAINDNLVCCFTMLILLFLSSLRPRHCSPQRLSHYGQQVSLEVLKSGSSRIIMGESFRKMTANIDCFSFLQCVSVSFHWWGF